MSKTLWWADELGENAHPLDRAVDDALEHLHHYPNCSAVVLHELRPSRVDDVCLDDLMEYLDDCLGDYLYEHDDFSTENGSAHFDGSRVPEPLRQDFKRSLINLLTVGVDFSEAQWQLTGERKTIDRAMLEAEDG